MLQQSTLDFLKNLSENNNREWFHANKKEYEIAKENFETICQEILDEITKLNPSFAHTKVKDCMFRINRDVRFAKDKSPYKKNFAAAFGVGGKKSGKIDFYFHLQPNGESFLGGGMWQPTPSQLAGFRQEIDYNPQILKEIIEEKNFRAYFKEIYGEQTKTAPRGYSVENPEINLLRYKELFFMHRFSEKDILAENFIENTMNGCQLLKPYIDYLNALFYEN